MTAPTPQEVTDLGLRLKHSAGSPALAIGLRDLLADAADALAAVTAERDQARQMLADAEQKIASMELDASLREEDERFADPL